MKLKSPRLAIVLVFLAGCSPGEEGAGPGGAGADDGQAIPEGRLPVDVEPLGYELELQIDPRVREFSGRVDIRLRVDARIMAAVELLRGLEGCGRAAKTPAADLPGPGNRLLEGPPLGS